MKIIIVLGCEVVLDQNGNYIPGDMLQRRLDQIKDLVNHDTVIITSGGNGGHRPLATSKVMKTYLTHVGINPSQILEEELSLNTIENCWFSRLLLDHLNLLSQANIYIVTSSFHVPRTEIIAKTVFPDQDIHLISSSCSPEDEQRHLQIEQSLKLQIPMMIQAYQGFKLTSLEINKRLQGRTDR